MRSEGEVGGVGSEGEVGGVRSEGEICEENKVKDGTKEGEGRGEGVEVGQSEERERGGVTGNAGEGALNEQRGEEEESEDEENKGVHIGPIPRMTCHVLETKDVSSIIHV